MKTLPLSIFVISVIIFGSISPIWATSDLSVNLSASGAPAQATFKFSESVSIEYPNGGKLKNLLTEKTYTINFTEKSDNTDVQDLVHQLNTELARDQKSPVIITDLTVRYFATLVGDAKSASIDYNLELIPTLTSYVIKKGANDNDPTIIDPAWMGLAIKDPVIIKTAQYGDVEINTPISFVKKVAPDVYSNIQGTKAEDALKNNLIDARSILQEPLDQWVHLFDPAYTLSETSDFGYAGQKVAITTYTIGPNTLPYQKPNPHEVEFLTDAIYKLTTFQHDSSASVNIEGHAITTNIGGTLAFGTTPQVTYAGPQPSWLDNAYPTILIVIGGLAVIAFWAIFFRRFKDRK